MAVFTRYAEVLDAEGKPLTVREALALINQTLDEALAEQEGDFDADSRWALDLVRADGFDEGDFGVAEQLSKAKNTSVDGMVEAGIVDVEGAARCVCSDHLSSTAEWDPAKDHAGRRGRRSTSSSRPPIAAREALAELIAKLGPEAEIARELAYRLYVLASGRSVRKRRSGTTASCRAWPEVTRLARETRARQPEQQQLFGEE